ncbi:MAG: polysaccharide pyruvyl transferase family protein [Lachnospiraceae bacterium]|jgi:polysaccharide pyruvyl transferase WcaK-like protein|nr:polysaccharide pyruvyl transferase family protein [Lachnospiraceae bacterium]
MEKIGTILYMHGGSGNHGCEALVNTMTRLLAGRKLAVLSVSVAEDKAYSLSELCAEGKLALLQERHFKRHRPVHILYALYRLLTGDRESFIRYRYHEVFSQETPALAISIGGDNYCYETMINDLKLMNSAFNKKGAKTVLLGCSIEEETLKDPQIVADMQLYHTIIARESLTYVNLKKLCHPRLFLFPDPAFALAKKELPLPDGFAAGNTVGLNLSPLVQAGEQQAGITMAAYKALVRHIIENTDMQIALIPHVVWARNDDRVPLRELYDCFAASGRVVLIADASCEELKGYIARLRFFVGARTHATIAAYSSLVPALALGYSVKARGIALDLFGTEENYVVPVQSLKSENDLVAAFDWLRENETDIRKHLGEIMPEYVGRVQGIKEVVEGIL